MTNSTDPRTKTVQPPTSRPSAALRTPSPRAAAPSTTAAAPSYPSYDLNAAYAAFAAQVPDADNVRNNDVTNPLYAIGYHSDNWFLWQQCLLATAH